VAKEDRGFASMDRNRQRDIASKGGKAAHQKGTAHEWTSEEARDAGRKGGVASHRRKLEQRQPEARARRRRSERTVADERRLRRVAVTGGPSVGAGALGCWSAFGLAIMGVFPPL
jgi:general stress protein YciG